MRIPKALIKLPSGSTVTIEGTAAEVEALVNRLEGRRPAAVASERKARSGAANQTGPRGWLSELVADGFFNEPRGQRQILEKLAEGGHHLKDSDITRQLQTMTRDRVLRRKKAPLGENGREVWGYSKW